MYVPSTVEYIDDSAFYECYHLGHVEISDNNEKYYTEQGGIREKGTGRVVFEPYMDSYGLPRTAALIEFLNEYNEW